MGPTLLFTHLKIILLQYFQFSTKYAVSKWINCLSRALVMSEWCCVCENYGAEYVSHLLSMLVRKLLKVPAVC